MDGADSSPGAGGLDSASADLQARAGDLDLLLHRLVEKLRGVPDLNMVVSYRHGRLRRLLGDLPYVNDLHTRSQPISAIQVHVGASDYLLEATSTSISCRIVGHPASNATTQQPVAFSRWIGDLIATVAEHNQATQESVASLESLILYDRPE